MARTPAGSPELDRLNAPEPEPPASAQESVLESVLAELARCRLCRDAPRFGAALPHEPRPIAQAATSARLCLAGQAPGLRAHRAGLPFADPSGDRLRHWLGLDDAAFYDPARVAILPMGFCFPGYDARNADLPPRRECAPLWRRRLFAALPRIELVLAIGAHARDWHLPERARQPLGETVRDWRAVLERPGAPRVIALPHPSWRNNAWLRRHPWFESELLPDLRQQIARLTGA